MTLNALASRPRASLSAHARRGPRADGSARADPKTRGIVRNMHIRELGRVDGRPANQPIGVSRNLRPG